MKNITIKSLRDKQNETNDSAENFFKKPKNKIQELEKKPTKSKKINTISKTILFTIFVLIVGGVGGIVVNQFALPYLLFKYPSLNQYEFLERVNEGRTIIQETKEVKISQDNTITEAIKKVSPSVVEIIESASDGSSSFYKGAGIILMSDGYIITSIDNITPTEKDPDEEKRNIIKVKLKDGKLYETKLIEIDIPTGLAIIKIEKNDLPVIALSNSDNLQLGETVIIIDSAVVTDIVSKFVNDFTVEVENEKPILQKRVKIVNSLKNSFDGAPIINTRGEIIGISQSGTNFIPTNEVMDFIDIAIKKEL